MPACLTEEIMKQLLTRTQNVSQDLVVASPNLSQPSLLNEMDLDDVDLPSTQPCHNNQLESGEDLILHTCLTPPRRTERLLDHGHPLKEILGFQSTGRERMVGVQWWEMDESNGSHCKGTEPLRELMKKKWSREMMRDFLKKECDDNKKKITAIVSESNWQWMMTGKRTDCLLPNGPRTKQHRLNQTA